MRAFNLFVAACALPLCLAAAATAEEAYPSRTVKLVVPATPGGPVDAIARILADAFKSSGPSRSSSRTARVRARRPASPMSRARPPTVTRS